MGRCARVDLICLYLDVVLAHRTILVCGRFTFCSKGIMSFELHPGLSYTVAQSSKSDADGRLYKTKFTEEPPPTQRPDWTIAERPPKYSLGFATLWVMVVVVGTRWVM